MFLAEKIEGALCARSAAKQDEAKQPATGMAERLAALPDLPYAELRAEWRKLYRARGMTS
jgi:hypothetical protein